MVNRSARIRLHDILTAIDEAAGILDESDFAACQGPLATRRAAERCVEITFESGRHIPDDLIALYPNSPWQEIRSIGNRLRHEYQRADDLVM